LGPQFGSVIVLQLAKRHALSSPTCNNFSNPSMAMTNMFGWDNNSHKTATQPCCTKNSICRSEPLRERGKGEKGKRGKGEKVKGKRYKENKKQKTKTKHMSIPQQPLCFLFSNPKRSLTKTLRSTRPNRLLFSHPDQLSGCSLT
jgi:hypothetical protein